MGMTLGACGGTQGLEVCGIWGEMVGGVGGTAVLFG